MNTAIQTIRTKTKLEKNANIKICLRERNNMMMIRDPLDDLDYRI